MSNFNQDDQVELTISGEVFQCSRTLLSHSSEYFAAMFNGSFLESNRRQIELKDVNQNGFRQIISILQANSNNSMVLSISDENVETLDDVFNVCDMLQFNKLKQRLHDDLIAYHLTGNNSIQLWQLATKYNLEKLALQAKYLAIVYVHRLLPPQPSTIPQNLDMTTICEYIILCCLFPELEELNQNHRNTKSGIIQWFLLLWNWLHGNRTTLSVRTDSPINIQLDLNMKNNVQNESVLLREFILDTMTNFVHIECPISYASTSSSLSSNPYLVLHLHGTNASSNNDNNPNTNKIAFIGWPSSAVIQSGPTIRNLFDLQCLDNLIGYELIFWREYIYVIGGEYGLGRGKWNRSILRCNTVKSSVFENVGVVIPSPRRHFQTCLCGEYLYIIGGTGTYRVHQDNMFWYHLTEERFSAVLELPTDFLKHFSLKLNVCCYKSQLLLMDLISETTFIHDPIANTWRRVSIGPIGDYIVEWERQPPKLVTIFAFNSHLYVKGRKLTELRFCNTTNTFQVMSQTCRSLTDLHYTEIESFTVDRFVYTTYTVDSVSDSSRQLLYEQFDMRNKKGKMIEQLNSLASKMEHSTKKLMYMFNYKMLEGLEVKVKCL